LAALESRDNNRPKARVKKETIRKLDSRPLAPSELEDVAGGVLRKPYTTDCPQSY